MSESQLTPIRRLRDYGSRRRLAGLSVVLIAALLAPGAAQAAKRKRKTAAPGSGRPEISAEERQLAGVAQAPDADAVQLNRERNGKIVKKGDDWVNVLHYHWRLKVLTEAGKRFGEVRIPARKYSRVSNIRARTIKADGTIVPVAADQIFEKVAVEVADLKFTEWVFNFPAVEPGAILEYQFDRHDNSLFSTSSRGSSTGQSSPAGRE
ncbi:MAG: DUF3857 domain-containing protein [Acidobacteriota bacterium]